jgi:hypothetical protein
VRDRHLQGIETVIERQQRVPAKSDDDGLVLDRQGGGFWRFGAGRRIGDGAALLPLATVFGLIS